MGHRAALYQAGEASDVGLGSKSLLPNRPEPSPNPALWKEFCFETRSLYEVLFIHRNLKDRNKSRRKKNSEISALRLHQEQGLVVHSSGVRTPEDHGLHEGLQG